MHPLAVRCCVSYIHDISCHNTTDERKIKQNKEKKTDEEQVVINDLVTGCYLVEILLTFILTVPVTLIQPSRAD